ncbi:MAG: HD domain-containing protein [Candidatus Woesearchaeota archaeon]
MKLSKKTEEKLKTAVIKYLKKEGPSFDIPHTKAAVYYMKKLLKEEKGNEKILVSTMYLHDVGYYRLIKNNKNLEKRLKAKKRHMKRGAKLAKKILKKIGGFSKDEIKRISYLVKTHDILERKRGTDEQLVFETDSLAMIDKKRVPGTLSKKEYKRFLEIFKRKRLPDFKTKSGKRFLNNFLKTD